MIAFHDKLIEQAAHLMSAAADHGCTDCRAPHLIGGEFMPARSYLPQNHDPRREPQFGGTRSVRGSLTRKG